MERLVSSNTRRLSMNWQNNEASFSEIKESGPAAATSALSLNIEAANPIAIVTSEVANVDVQPLHRQYKENQRVSRKISRRCPRESMYEAAYEGNWPAAEALLKQDEGLAYGEITDMGDRALHIAAFMAHAKFIQRLIPLVKSRSELGLHDGRGYTACCYAAMTGRVEIAHIIMDENTNLGTARNRYGTTPLQLAASYGNADIVSYFLKRAHAGDLLRKEWFDLLLVTIRSKMYDVALEILDKVPSLAVMTDVEGTALHVLAQMDISLGWKSGGNRIAQPDVCMLAERLWAAILGLERGHVLELMKNPPILPDAAKVGNMELISMITRAYPDLLWHVNNDQCSIFHIAVMYRHESMLELVKLARNIKDFNAISEDLNGNNILHLAGKLVPLHGLTIVSEPDLQMQRELAWFKAVEAIVPPFFLEKRNVDGHKPREVFWMEHKRLLEESASHMKSTAESCMLIATIILTVVFAAAFTPPGGYNQDTGIPILLKNKWFACFIIFEAFALFSSTYCIIGFWSIIASNYEEDQFLILPIHLRYALSALLLSLFCAISAFMSAFFLVFVKERTVLVKSCMLSVYVWLIVGISFQFYKLCRKTNLLEYYYRMGASPSRYHLYYDSLLRRLYQFVASILFYIHFYFKKE